MTKGRDMEETKKKKKMKNTLKVMGRIMAKEITQRKKLKMPKSICWSQMIFCKLYKKHLVKFLLNSEKILVNFLQPQKIKKIKNTKRERQRRRMKRKMMKTMVVMRIKMTTSMKVTLNTRRMKVMLNQRMKMRKGLEKEKLREKAKRRPRRKIKI